MEVETQARVNLTEYTITEMMFSKLVMDRDYRFQVQEVWDSSKPSFNKMLGYLDASDEGSKYQILNAQRVSGENSAFLLSSENRLMTVDLGKNRVTVWVASDTYTGILKPVQEFKKLFIPNPDFIDNKIKVRFWYSTSNGARNVTRDIIVPQWDGIRENYHSDTLENLTYLMDDFKPSTAGGQLIVFHGPPGTGKSYSLRALLHSWREWATPEYVLDPEQLFSGSQSYMASLVLEGAYEDDDEDEEVQGKWKVLLLEDSGELLSADAKSRTGQGLSRLLNLVDGLIGQGLRVLVLITTNEELGNLHPAVSREGRCAAAVSYKPFNRFDAQRWLERREADTIILNHGQKEYTLADLFALTKEEKSHVKMPSLREFGFRVPA